MAVANSAGAFARLQPGCTIARDVQYVVFLSPRLPSPLRLPLDGICVHSSLPHLVVDTAPSRCSTSSNNRRERLISFRHFLAVFFLASLATMFSITSRVHPPLHHRRLSATLRHCRPLPVFLLLVAHHFRGTSANTDVETPLVSLLSFWRFPDSLASFSSLRESRGAPYAAALRR
jgi:hypothetical protein